jgi:hypothetical protein
LGRGHTGDAAHNYLSFNCLNRAFSIAPMPAIGGMAPDLSRWGGNFSIKRRRNPLIGKQLTWQTAYTCGHCPRVVIFAVC